MNLREIAQEFLKRVEKGYLDPFYVRRQSWPSNTNIEILKSGMSGPAIAGVDLASVGSMTGKKPIYLRMGLRHQDELLVAWWCPSVEDAVADDWDVVGR